MKKKKDSQREMFKFFGNMHRNLYTFTHSAPKIKKPLSRMRITKNLEKVAPVATNSHANDLTVIWRANRS